MKKFLFLVSILVALFCGQVHGATIITSLTNWDQALSTPSTNAIVIQQVGQPLADGTRLVVGLPRRYPNNGSGSWTNVLNQGTYRLYIEGIVLPHPIYFAVPAGTNTYNLTQSSGSTLLVSGGNFYNFTPGVLQLTSRDGSVAISPSSGVGTVDLSVQGAGGLNGTNDSFYWFLGNTSFNVLSQGLAYDVGLSYNLSDGSFSSLLWYSLGSTLYIPNGVFTGSGAGLTGIDGPAITTGKINGNRLDLNSTQFSIDGNGTVSVASGFEGTNFTIYSRGFGYSLVLQPLDSSGGLRLNNSSGVQQTLLDPAGNGTFNGTVAANEVDSVTAKIGSLILTNENRIVLSSWANAPSGHVDLAKSGQKYSITATSAITGFDNIPVTTGMNFVSFNVTNGTASDLTLYITASGYTQNDGLRSFVCTNGTQREIRFSGSVFGVRGISQTFY